jgi:hypothetical protein
MLNDHTPERAHFDSAAESRRRPFSTATTEQRPPGSGELRWSRCTTTDQGCPGNIGKDNGQPACATRRSWTASPGQPIEKTVARKDVLVNRVLLFRNRSIGKKSLCLNAQLFVAFLSV